MEAAGNLHCQYSRGILDTLPAEWLAEGSDADVIGAITRLLKGYDNVVGVAERVMEG